MWSESLRREPWSQTGKIHTLREVSQGILLWEDWGLSQPAVSMEAWLVICAVDREDVRLACTLISAKLRCTQGSELPVCSLPLVHTWQGGLGPPPPSLLGSSPSPWAHGKLYPTQVATRIAAWSSTTAPLKQCPEKYRALQRFSEHWAFRSGRLWEPNSWQCLRSCL